MKLSLAVLSVGVASVSAQDVCQAAIGGMAAAASDPSAVCPAISNIFESCANMSGYDKCCGDFDKAVQALTAVFTECGDIMASPQAICKDMSTICSGKCGKALANTDLTKYTYCTAKFIEDGISAILSDLGNFPSVPGLDPSTMIQQAMSAFVAPDFAPVCGLVDYLDEQSCTAMLTDAANFDFDAVMEPFYPDFDIPQSVDVSFVLSGITDAQAILSDLDTAIRQDLENFLGAVQIPDDFFSAITVTTNADGTVVVTTSLQPPTDFEQQLKDLFPQTFDTSFNELGSFDVKTIPDGSEWTTPSLNGKTWGDLVTALTSADLSQVNFATAKQVTGAEGMSAQGEAASRDTTYADLGREQPNYGTAAAPSPNGSGASQMTIGAAALAAAALAYLA